MATALEPIRKAEAGQKGSDRSFGYVFAAVFALIGLSPLWHLGMPRWWAVAISVAFVVVAVWVPRILHPLNRAWLAFGELLHRIVSPFIMGVVFFLVVTPTGWIMRLRGRDLLSMKWQPELPSYWIECDAAALPASETMKKQF